MEVSEHFKLLGMKAKDVVTGFTGVIESISFDLYGCIQYLLRPPVNEKGEDGPAGWYDVSRIKLISKTPVMEKPDFDFGIITEGKKGPAKKPVI
jgi:hypothetical protein